LADADSECGIVRASYRLIYGDDEDYGGLSWARLGQANSLSRCQPRARRFDAQGAFRLLFPAAKFVMKRSGVRIPLVAPPYMGDLASEFDDEGLFHRLANLFREPPRNHHACNRTIATHMGHLADVTICKCTHRSQTGAAVTVKCTGQSERQQCAPGRDSRGRADPPSNFSTGERVECPPPHGHSPPKEFSNRSPLPPEKFFANFQDTVFSQFGRSDFAAQPHNQIGLIRWSSARPNDHKRFSLAR
jgi:hypothetical protein